MTLCVLLLLSLPRTWLCCWSSGVHSLLPCYKTVTINMGLQHTDASYNNPWWWGTWNTSDSSTYTIIELIENDILAIHTSPTMLTKRDTKSFSILILGVYAACNVLGLEKIRFPFKLWCLIFQRMSTFASPTSPSCWMMACLLSRFPPHRSRLPLNTTFIIRHFSLRMLFIKWRGS